MSEQTPRWRKVAAIAFVLGVLGAQVRAYGVGSLVWPVLLLAWFAISVLRLKRWRRNNPGERFPAGPEPIRIAVAPTRLEAALLLAVALGLGAVVLSCTIELAFRSVGGADQVVPGWTDLPMTVGLLTAPFMFLAYAVLVAGRARRAGEPSPSVVQFAGPAAVREAVNRFRSSPPPQ